MSGAQGYYWVGDDALVAKIDAALAEFDEAKRAELYGEIIGEFVDKGIIIGLFRQDQILQQKTRLIIRFSLMKLSASSGQNRQTKSYLNDMR